MISFIIIYAGHGVIDFFKRNSTSPNIRDLANERTKQYDMMRNILETNARHVAVPNQPIQLSQETNILPPPANSDDQMKNELKSYFGSLI
jgi:hypothetical protein